ncbi:hypothetical protein RND81_03G009400 [Saponaria officinalis]|uniref:Uncharacterized protein n=1 Tax=Saponaria officinalis TaxID=3572 RepID=A0AAW1M1S0_SAPOF
MDRFKSKKTLLSEEGADIRENEIYYDVVCGRKKGKVYDVGSAAPMYFGSRNFTSSDDSSSKGYSPGIISQLREKNATLKKRLGEMESWRESVMSLLEMQFGAGIINPTCGPNIS